MIDWCQRIGIVIIGHPQLMETTMNFWRNWFRTPSPEMLAARELDQARRSLLEAHSAAEYADSMIAYHQARIDRLNAFLSQERAA